MNPSPTAALAARKRKWSSRPVPGGVQRLETRMTTAAEIQESYEIYRERVCQLIDRPFETVPGVLFLLRDQYTRVQVTARLLSVYDGCHGRLREIEAYTEAMSQLLRLNQPFGA